MRSLPFNAFGDLWVRYREIFVHAWREQRLLGQDDRLPHELSFSPAQLELQDSPPHPAPLWTARVLLAVALVLVGVAYIGQIDIVATAPGQLVPNANIKIVQPAITGVVHRILVQNGQRVSAGQLLMELDPTLAAASVDEASLNRTDAQLSVARAHALLAAQSNGVPPQVTTVAGASASRQANTQSLADSEYREYMRKASALDAELHKRQAELATTQEEVEKFRQIAPLARQQADDYRDLAAQKYVSAHDYLDKETTAINDARQLAEAQSHVQELAAAIEEQRHTIEASVATFRREQLEILDRFEAQAAQQGDEVTKAAAREQFTQLKSPVSGVVAQLHVHTIGGVVASTQAVMEIVPDDTLEVEALIGNRDIGFVNPGQSAIIKITTFPYTRFGYLTGVVLKVSDEAVPDRRLGLVFPARIRIPRNQFKVQDKWINLSPGMEVSVEIRTGRQKVWQYFLSPLIDTGLKSLHER